MPIERVVNKWNPIADLREFGNRRLSFGVQNYFEQMSKPFLVTNNNNK